MPPKGSGRKTKRKEPEPEVVVETVDDVEDEEVSSSKRVKFTDEVEEDEGGADGDAASFESSAGDALVISSSFQNTDTTVANIPTTSSALMQYNPLPGRLSSLFAPELSLSGHESAIYTIAFDPTGRHLCSGSMDRQIYLWDLYGEDEPGKNYNVLSGHKNAVLEVHWNNPSFPAQIVSCSADKTVCLWDANKGKRMRSFTEHTAVVNTCHSSSLGPMLIASGSDDCTAILWDSRRKYSIATLYHDYQVLSVCLTSDGQYLYTGGIDNIIRRFDTRMLDESDPQPDMVFNGHTDTVTGLSISPDGNHLLSNSMDCTLRVWDTRPFIAAGEDRRCESVVTGNHHGAEKNLLRCMWSPDQSMVTCGSADRKVHIWDARDTTNLREKYYLPGHTASVNQAVFHPVQSERVLASCGSDKVIFVGEYQP